MLNKLYSFTLRTVPRTWLIRLSLVFRKFSSLLFYGDKVECPVCGKTFSRFLPYGRTLRKNVLCPNCLSLERHRLLWLYLKEKTNFFTENLKVLHIAPEQCFYKRFKEMPNLDYTTGDLVSPLADVKFDIQNIPFENNTFDVVICNHVLEHVENDMKALSEIKRILKKTGFAILMVPIDFKRHNTYEDPKIKTSKEREKHYWQSDHRRLYGLDYSERLAKAGLYCSDENFIHLVSEDKKQRYRLTDTELMFAYRKRNE